MTGIRFSMRWMLAAVAFFALVAAALTDGSSRWAALIALSSVSVMLASVLGVIYRKDESRSFWIGFAVFGWVYLILSLQAAGLNEAIPTNVLFNDLYPFFRRSVPVNPTGPNPAWVKTTEMEHGRMVAVIVAPYDFHRLGHSVCTILFALAGGTLGRWFFATKERPGRP